MFYIIGDCKDITVKGLEIIKRCDKVYLEAYTSMWNRSARGLLRPQAQHQDNRAERRVDTRVVHNIKVKQPTLESLTKKKPPKFMSVSEASQQLLEILNNKGQDNLVTENTLCIGLTYFSLQEMSQVDLGEPLHSLIIL